MTTTPGSYAAANLRSPGEGGQLDTSSLSTSSTATSASAAVARSVFLYLGQLGVTMAAIPGLR